MSAALLLAALAAAAPAAGAPPEAGGRLWTDAPPRPRPQGPPAIPALVRAALPAVVGIVTTTQRTEPSSDPFHQLLERTYGAGEGEKAAPQRGIGSGFFIRKDGLILTNAHVVDSVTDLAVQVGADPGSERVFPATVVGKDDATDLALLRIEGGPFPVLSLGDSDQLQVGEWVVAIGNPFGLSRSTTTGIVSFKGRRDPGGLGKGNYSDFIQTDAAINPGNSGGPLLDGGGAVVAINTAVNPSGQGIGFAVPIAMFKELAPQLAGRGRVTRGWMGVSAQERLTPELAESFGVPGGRGVLVTEVAEGGPAARAGLRGGDVVTAFAGEPLSESWRLRWLAALAPPGREVVLTVLRQGKPLSVRVAMGELPAAAAAPPSPAPAPLPPRGPFGIAAEERSAEEAATLPHGVRIGPLDVRSAAFRAGLREGDLLLELDGHPVDDRPSFERLAATGAPIARLLVRRGARLLYVGLRRDSSPQGASGAPPQTR